MLYREFSVRRMSCIAFALVIASLSSVAQVDLTSNTNGNSVRAASSGITSKGKAQNLRQLQHLYAPYWIAEDGWDTEVHLRNNLPSEPLSVTPILHAVGGEVVTLNSITVPGNGLRLFRVGASLNAALSKQSIAVSQRYGYIEFQYSAWHSQNLFVPVMLHRIGQPVVFHIDSRPEAEKSASGGFDGFWWNRHAGLQDILVLTNEGSNRNATRVVLSDSSGRRVAQEYDLAPHSMLRLSVLDSVRKAGLISDFGGIHIEPTFSGSFQAVHFLYDTAKGFSALMKIFERIPGTDLHRHRAWSRDEGWMLWAPMLALASPDPGLWLPSNTELRPYLFLENLAPKTSNAQLTLFWRSRRASGKTAPQIVELDANAAKKLDVSSTFRDLPQDANWATVSILTDSRPDEVIAVAASFDNSGRYGAQTPFSAQLAAHWEGALWEVDAAHNTLITVGNGGRHNTRAQLTFRYQTAKGMDTYVIEQKLNKDEQLFVDMTDLIRNQVPDIHGHAFSREARNGSYTLLDLEHPAMGNLFEGKVVTDKRHGDVAYGCMICCGVEPAGLTPSSVTLILGDSTNFTATGMDSCSHRPMDITGDYNTWGSTDTTVATAQYAGATAVGQGSATIWGDGTLPSAGILDSPDSCPTTDDTEQADMKVQVPSASRIVSTTTNSQLNAGQSPCPAGLGGWQRVVTKIVTDQNGADIVAGGQKLTEDVAIGLNQLNIGSVATQNTTTDASGKFQDTFTLCSTFCPGSTRESDLSQAITDVFNGKSYTLAPISIKMTCSGITINGQ